MPITPRLSFVLAALGILVLASCGGGGDDAGAGGPPPITYRVLDLQTGAVTTESGINLAGAQYTTTKMVFRQVIAGSFTRGSLPASLGHDAANEAPGTAVVAMPAMWIAVFELTQGQWATLTGDPGNQPWRSLGPASVTATAITSATLPASGLSEVELDAAVSAWNGSVVGTGRVAIPTRDQWEYACRGSTTTLFFWGDTLDGATAASFAVTRDSAAGSTGPQPVISSRFSNGLGLWDMAGNVREWTKDGGTYDLRGGGWSDNLLRCRSANRITTVDVYRHALSGARLVLTAP